MIEKVANIIDINEKVASSPVFNEENNEFWIKVGNITALDEEVVSSTFWNEKVAVSKVLNETADFDGFDWKIASSIFAVFNYLLDYQRNCDKCKYWKT